MDRFSHALVRAASLSFPLREPVLELGSRQVDRAGSRYDLRTLFPERTYIGCDLEAGPGVDRVENAERLSFRDGEAGTVIALNLFEHVWDFRAGFAEIGRITHPEGAAIVLIPFALHIHPYPSDFWRVTPEGMRRLLAPFPVVLLGTLGTPGMPRFVFAVAFKGLRGEDVAERCEAFRGHLRAGLGRSMGVLTRAWLRIGSWCFGRRYFRSHLQRDRIECEVSPEGRPEARPVVDRP
jgi:hypothetical protein